MFLATGILLLLSLVSYHAQDPSWDTAAGHLRPVNLAGPFGAHVSDILLQAFGAGAFLFPLLAFVTGWKWIRSEEIDTPIFRLAGFALFLSCFSAAMSLLRGLTIFDHVIPVGGITGEIVADKLQENLNPLGAAVVTVTGMIISIYFFSTFTLEKVIHWFNPITEIFQRIGKEWQDWRERQRERALEKEGSQDCSATGSEGSGGAGGRECQSQQSRRCDHRH